MMDWYEENIEEPIRPIVKLLRDNGFNTFSSCGHIMYCQADLWLDVPIQRLWDLLRNNGYEQFKIKTEIKFDGIHRRLLTDLTIWFPMEDGTYHPKSEGSYNG